MFNLIRIFYFLFRFFNSIRFLGLLNSFQIFCISKISKKKQLKINLFHKNFYFRPIIDSGAYNRLTKSQYIINGSINNPIEIIIDAGANIGSQSIRLINSNPKIKKIICIEPDVESYNLCVKNLESYNAKIFNNALTNTSDDVLTIQKTINSEMSEIIESSGQVIQSNNIHKISTISMNEIIERENLNKIDFLKLDINGYEDDLFNKNTEWLKITKCIGFNNSDINNITSKIIKSYEDAVGQIKIYNIDQMIFLTKINLDWFPKKGFMSSKNIGFIEIDQRY